MSTLPASFQHANKAALSAALAENPDSGSNGSDTEPGEIQEVDMQAQADDIRTVFSHPTNFNVKVCHENSLHTVQVFISLHYSTPYIHLGPFGSIPLPQKAATYLKPPCLPSLKPLSLRPPVPLPHRGGWRISKKSSVSQV